MYQRSHLFRAAVAALTVATLGLAACGSSSSNDDSTGVTDSQELSVDEAKAQVEEILGPIPEVTGSTTRGVNGTVITLAGTGTNTSGGQQTLPGLDDGAKARFERANREGGVNGYTFDYIGFEDDHGLPGDSQQAVQQLVNSDEVFALVPYVPLAGANSAFINENKVPSFGWLGQDFCTWDENVFMFSTTGQTTCENQLPGKIVGITGGLQLFLDETGQEPEDVKVAIFGAKGASSEAAVAGFDVAAQAVGMDVVYAKSELPAPTDPPLTDFTPVAQSIMSSGANLVVTTTTVPSTLAMISSLKGLGYTGEFLAGSPTGALLQSPQTAQIVDGAYASVASTGSIPELEPEAYEQVQADLDAIGADAPADGIGTNTGYWAADLFLQALAAVDGEVTAEKVTNVLNGGDFTYEGIPGVTCTTEYPVGRVLPSVCAGLLRYNADSKEMEALSPYEEVGGYAIADKPE